MKRIWSFVVSLFLIFNFQNANAQFQIFAPIMIAEIDYEAQYKQLYGDVSIKPGIYRLINLNSQNCLGIRSENIVPVYKMKQGNCRQESWYATMHSQYWRYDIAIMPTNDNRFTLRWESSSTDRSFFDCASVARNVFIGAADIDFIPCDLPTNSNDWGDAGVEDQRFKLLAVGNGFYEIRTNDDKCFAVRDASKEHDIGVIKWDCTGGADQRWKLEYQKPIASAKEIKSLELKYWYLRNKAFHLAKPVWNISYTGNPIRKTSSANDNGKQCAVECLDEAICKGFSWRPNYVDKTYGTKASCTLYSSITMTSSVSDGTLSGLIKR